MPNKNSTNTEDINTHDNASSHHDIKELTVPNWDQKNSHTMSVGQESTQGASLAQDVQGSFILEGQRGAYRAL